MVWVRGRVRGSIRHDQLMKAMQIEIRLEVAAVEEEAESDIVSLDLRDLKGI